jgi:hypothetical protein
MALDPPVGKSRTPTAPADTKSLDTVKKAAAWSDGANMASQFMSYEEVSQRRIHGIISVVARGRD